MDVSFRDVVGCINHVCCVDLVNPRCPHSGVIIIQWVTAVTVSRYLAEYPSPGYWSTIPVMCPNDHMQLCNAAVKPPAVSTQSHTLVEKPAT